MNKLTVTERETLWDNFLARWPLSSLSSMTLAEYTEAGNQDAFVYWIEKWTEALGSVWGGSSFKFGVYSRKDRSEKHDDATRRYSDDYAWVAKYGDSPEAAFETVRVLILQVASAAQAGRLDEVDAVDLGPAFKWKIAFLYQNRDAPQVVPIYRIDYLQAATGSMEKSPLALQRMLIAGRGERSLLEYGDDLWQVIEERMRTELTPEAARDYFEQSEAFSPVKAPTSKMAGFRHESSRELALALDNKCTTIYLEQGDWLDEKLANALENVVRYAPEKSRSSNLAANAPRLALGSAIVSVVVPSMEALAALCDAYASEESPPDPKPDPDRRTMTDMTPLNRILYGPPGTGKTYATVDAALEVLAPEFLHENRSNRAALKAQFDALASAGHVRFVTFHQSFSYEDFVEGLRAETGEDGQLRYEVVDGVFKSLCDAASARVTVQAEAPIDLSGRRVWKMSLGNFQGSDAYIFDECIDKGYALLGYGRVTDVSGCSDREQVYQRLLADDETITKDSYAVTAVSTFLLKVRVGDLVVVSEGNTKFRAIGEITGDYRVLDRDDQGDEYGQCRDVKWLRVYKPALPIDQLMNNQFSQMTLYELRPGAIDMDKLAGLLQSAQGEGVSMESPIAIDDRLGGYQVLGVSPEVIELSKPNGNRLPLAMSLVETLVDYVRDGKVTIEDIKEKNVFTKVPDTKLEPYLVNGYHNVLASLVQRLLQGSIGLIAKAGSKSQRDAKVLIIDEINRGNVARVFGELITLIEPSKRAGQPEALEVTLPYSKQRFSVPDNLYLIGTMNTADRSLATLDIALRRRFSFVEMPPRPDLLDGVLVEGVDIGAMLRAMNDRIEALLDRDHCLGHAYFMPLMDDRTLTRLAAIFRGNILPLLQEYFFEDWQRIQWVLNDHRKSEGLRFLSQPQNDVERLFGAGVAVNAAGQRWTLNDAAFGLIGAYAGIIEASGA